MINSMREAGAFAIETHCTLAEVERHGSFSRFETETCAVVYADKNQPSHSIRVFKFRDEQ